MAIDPRNMRPSDVVRLLNSTPLGPILDERQLYRHRTRAGFRIGDGRRVDLLRYIAWLFDERHTPKEDAPRGYDAVKEAARARSAALSASGRDIGELPEVVNPERKGKARENFQSFCEGYFPLTFHLNWSADHLTVIRKIEQAVLQGGLFALAMPRGRCPTAPTMTAPPLRTMPVASPESLRNDLRSTVCSSAIPASPPVDAASACLNHFRQTRRPRRIQARGPEASRSCETA